jgi:hypothetical protein
MAMVDVEGFRLFDLDCLFEFSIDVIVGVLNNDFFLLWWLKV